MSIDGLGGRRLRRQGALRLRGRPSSNRAFPAAIEVLEKLTDAIPKEPQGAERVGSRSGRRGNLEKANERFRQALQVDPSFLPAPKTSASTNSLLGHR